MIRAENISYNIGRKTLLQPTSVAFKPGLFHVIMGANGAGKSTLLKLLAKEIKPSAGRIYLNEKDLTGYSQTALATNRAVLSQHYHLAFAITVEEIVLMGRYPYFSTQPSQRDKQICNEAMALMDVEHLAERDYTTLSGGEAQKVQMSRVLAQIWNEEAAGAKVLFLDEPVSHLDVKYQYQLLRIAKSQCEKGTMVIAILHDINLALQFADSFYFMKDGAIVHTLDEPHSLAPPVIEEVFSVSSSILQVPGKPIPVVIF